MKKSKAQKRSDRKKKRHTPQHIYSEIYMTNYYISYGVDPKSFKDSIRRILGVYLMKELKGGYCGHFEDVGKSGNTIIWIWTRRKSISTLAHECFHATAYTLRGRMQLGNETDEAYAYLMEMLVRKIMERKKP